MGDVVAEAGVSRATFYKLFADKEACFVAAVEHLVERLLVTATRHFEAARAWPERLAAALSGALRMLADQPALAHLVLVEHRAAGQRAYERHLAGRRRLAEALDQAASGGEASPHSGGPDTASWIVLAQAEALVVDTILAGRTAQLPDLLPDLLYVTLLPRIGQQAALEASNAHRT